MERRKHIDISDSNINIGFWIHTVSAKKFTFIKANGVSFAITENNYYYDTKKDKVRYSFNNCKNASYNHLYEIFMQIYPGIFARCICSTEDNLTSNLERYSKIYNDHDYSNNPEIEKYVQQLVRK